MADGTFSLHASVSTHATTTIKTHLRFPLPKRSLPELLKLGHDLTGRILRVERPQVRLHQALTEPSDSEWVEPAEGQAAREPCRVLWTHALRDTQVYKWLVDGTFERTVDEKFKDRRLPTFLKW